MTSKNTTPESSPVLDPFELGSMTLKELLRLPESSLRTVALRVLAERAALPDGFAAFQNSL